MVRLLAIKQRR